MRDTIIMLLILLAAIAAKNTFGVPLLSHKDPFLLPYFQAHLHFSLGLTSDTQSSQILPLFDDLLPAKISLSVKVGFALSSVGSGWVWLGHVVWSTLHVPSFKQGIPTPGETQADHKTSMFL